LYFVFHGQGTGCIFPTQPMESAAGKISTFPLTVSLLHVDGISLDLPSLRQNPVTAKGGLALTASGQKAPYSYGDGRRIMIGISLSLLSSSAFKPLHFLGVPSRLADIRCSKLESGMNGVKIFSDFEK